LPDYLSNSVIIQCFDTVGWLGDEKDIQPVKIKLQQFPKSR